MRKLLSVLLAAALALTLFSGSLTAAVNEPEPPQDPAVSAETEESQEVAAEPVDPAPAEGDEADSPETPVPEAEAPEEPDAADGDVAEPEISGDLSEEEDEKASLQEKQDTVEEPGGTCGENVTWSYNSATGTLYIDVLDKNKPGIMSDFNGGGNIIWYLRTVPPWDAEGFVISNIEIAEGVTNIGESAFYTGYKTMATYDFTSITFPSTLENIGNYAFSGSPLESVVIPETLKQIGKYAFSESSRLSNVILEEGLTDIGACAFSETAIESIVIPESVISVGGSAFLSCRNLSHVQLPTSIAEIQYASFGGCTSLSTIEIPASVKSVGDFAFRSSSDQVITFDGDAPTLEEYVVTEEYEGYNSGSFDLTDTLVYSAANAASWSGSANFDPLYNTYYGYNTEVMGVCNHSGSKYAFDQNGHALVCDVCGRGYDFAEHSYDANGKCVCGYANHEHELEWQVDEYSHYKVCSICGFVIEEGLHTFEKDKCVCLICNQTVHQNYDTEYDENGHRKICRHCHEVFDEGPHTYNENKYSQGGYVGHYRKCDNCYYADESTLYPHVPSGEAFIKDNYQPHTVHFYKCGLCGGEYYEEHIRSFTTDYSSFVATDILNLPEEKALDILKKTFGEENVTIDNDSYDPNYVGAFVNFRTDTVCATCDYALGPYYISITANIENGIVSNVYLNSGARYNAPMLSRELPHSLTTTELTEIGKLGKAEYGGKTFTVTYTEKDASHYYAGEDIEGAKSWEYLFECDEYVGVYSFTNIEYKFDLETGKPNYYTIDLAEEEKSVTGYVVQAIQKYTPGDVNNDGKVTLDDAILTLKKTMNVDVSSATFIAEAAEVTGDNRLTLDDAIGVLKLAMKVQ